jgi:membrane protein implicated in regulation of membrane protease activity
MNVFKVVGIAAAAVVIFVLGIVIFSATWARVGLVTALVVVLVPLLVWAWFSDRKRREQRAGLEDI